MVCTTRNQLSVIAPIVRWACPPIAVAAVKVIWSVGEPKLVSTSDCTFTVIVGDDVPATDRTCSVAYRYWLDDTAESSTAVPLPVAVRAVPGGCSTFPRATGHEPVAPAVHRATSPTAPPHLYSDRSALNT